MNTDGLEARHFAPTDYLLYISMLVVSGMLGVNVSYEYGLMLLLLLFVTFAVHNRWRLRIDGYSAESRKEPKLAWVTVWLSLICMIVGVGRLVDPYVQVLTFSYYATSMALIFFAVWVLSVVYRLYPR
jgi:hypothetical protein